jgi:hypothetical protein
MANISQAAGGNGVSGTGAPGTPSGAYGATYSDNGNMAVTGSNAVRRSVSKTGGSVSSVKSVTSGLRTAYIGVECDIPALDATRTGA